MRREIGEWTVWRSDECVVAFNKRDYSMRVAPFSGRWRPLPPRGGGVLVDDGFLEKRWEQIENALMSKLNKLIHEAVDDRLAEMVFAVVYNELRMFEHEGWIDRVRPVHEHDCDSCIFLGRSGPWSLGGHDYYFCEQHGGIPTVIARNGVGPEYKSGLAIAATGADPELWEALQLAIQAGLLLGHEGDLVSMGYDERNRARVTGPHAAR